MMERMLGEKYPEITQELEDGASELLNIIFGQAKKVLNERGYRIEKAIPTIIRGTDVAIRHHTASPTVVLPFDTDLGVFHIEVTTQLEMGNLRRKLNVSN
jgi:chemotaxis protein CheX